VATLPARGRVPHATRHVYFFDHGYRDAAIHQREQVGAVEGPAIIEEPIAATVVPPGWTATADHYRNLILEKR